MPDEKEPEMPQPDLTSELITPEMRARADAVVDGLRREWAARDAVTDEANRAFDVAFRKALRKSRDADSRPLQRARLARW